MNYFEKNDINKFLKIVNELPVSAAKYRELEIMSPYTTRKELKKVKIDNVSEIHQRTDAAEKLTNSKWGETVTAGLNSPSYYKPMAGFFQTT